MVGGLGDRSWKVDLRSSRPGRYRSEWHVATKLHNVQKPNEATPCTYGDLPRPVPGCGECHSTTTQRLTSSARFNRPGLTCGGGALALKVVARLGELKLSTSS
ncbi:pantothenate synthetase [Anopheles sinensis]|uniref:Pantothenate synthetase n=1 Tax=Anopheles sinensis TaxID=74873 RepID=A0A084VJW7_ANOSI|nr:pantothenate synthetase [Anopheles sinensis]